MRGRIAVDVEFFILISCGAYIQGQHSTMLPRLSLLEITLIMMLLDWLQRMKLKTESQPP